MMTVAALLTRGVFPAWTPLVDPLYQRVAHLTDLWMWLLVPLVLVIAVVYQTAHKPRLGDVPLAALWMSLKILAAFAVLGVGIDVLYHYMIIWNAVAPRP